MNQQGLGEFLHLVSEKEKLFQEFLRALQRMHGSYGALVALGARNGFQFTAGDVVEVAMSAQACAQTDGQQGLSDRRNQLSRPSRHMASLLIDEWARGCDGHRSAGG